MRRLIIEDPVSDSALWSRRVGVFALATTGVSIGLARLSTLEPVSVLAVFGASLVLALLALLLAGSAAVVIWRTGRRGTAAAALGALMAIVLIAYPAYFTYLTFRLPPINGVSTDLEHPPTYMISSKAREARAGVTPPPESPAAAAAQRLAYPDLQPVLADLEPQQAYDMSVRIAKDLGWRLIDGTPPNLRGDGHIDYIVRSPIFGFVDDITIRISPLSNQTRIDLRSTSRVGRHDFGANARHLRKFIAEAQDSLQAR